MTRALITESHLASIGNAIRYKLGVDTTYKPSEMAAAIRSISGSSESDLGTKTITANGTYAASSDSLDGYSSVTVNVANSYAAADEGKVVSSGALVAQTARSAQITANGTYDTTNNNKVTVNVSGGGGGSNPTFLIHSDASDILAQAYSSDWKSGDTTWGGFALNGSGYNMQGGLLRIDGTSYASYDLGAANSEDVTIYALAMQSGNASGDLFVIANGYAAGGGSDPALYVRSRNYIMTTVYGNDTSTGISAIGDIHALAISIDVTNKTVRYYVDGQAFGSKAFSNCGRYVTVGSGPSGTNNSDYSFLFAAVVGGVESDATIIANQRDMLDFAGKARLLEP